MDEVRLKEKIRDIEKGFEEYMPGEKGYQKTVCEAVNYSILAGGKRLRPLFMHEMYVMLGGADEKTIRPFMMAIEMIHTYSLVHDDLPAMDDDDYRRGKLTTHKKYGEAMGILAGDALLNAAFETAFRAFGGETDADCIGRALKVLGNKAGIYGMVGGQAVDVENNGRFVEEDMLYFVYKNKTSALLEAGLMIGAILAGVSDDVVRQVEKIGTKIGIAFQIQDDILDVEGDADIIGKPTHSDEKNGKSTYAAIHGLDKSRAKVKEYTEEGLEVLDSLAAHNNEAKEFLHELMESLVEREK